MVSVSSLLTHPLAPAITFGIGCAIGCAAGWAACAYASASIEKDAVANFLAVFIAFVWALSVIASINDPTLSTPLPVHGIFGAVVGYFFGEGIRQKKGLQET